MGAQAKRMDETKTLRNTSRRCGRGAQSAIVEFHGSDGCRGGLPPQSLREAACCVSPVALRRAVVLAVVLVSLQMDAASSPPVSLGPAPSAPLRERVARDLLPCPLPFSGGALPDAQGLSSKSRAVRSRLRRTASSREWADEAVATLNELNARAHPVSIWLLRTPGDGAGGNSEHLSQHSSSGVHVSRGSLLSAVRQQGQLRGSPFGSCSPLPNVQCVVAPRLDCLP